MQVTFYLTEASANTAAGPFNISGKTAGDLVDTVEIQANVSKATLLAGYTEEIANNITGGTVTSTDGTCNTSDTWSVNELYTPPLTPTPTPTSAVTSYEYAIETTGGATREQACTNFDSGLPETVYAASQFSNSVVQFFTDPGLTLGFPGSGDYHAFRRDIESNSQKVSAPVSPGGFISGAIISCTA